MVHRSVGFKKGVKTKKGERRKINEMKEEVGRKGEWNRRARKRVIEGERERRRESLNVRGKQ